MNFIHDLCKEYDITNYTVNSDGSIDVNGDVYLNGFELTELPLNFNKVTGIFDCDINLLTTLKGCPKWVGDYFSCRSNSLTSLEFSPEYVGGNFYCEGNYLTDNISDSEIKGSFFTGLKQYGLTPLNYNEWRKLYKRKKTLNELYTRHM